MGGISLRSVAFRSLAFDDGDSSLAVFYNLKRLCFAHGPIGDYLEWYATQESIGRL
jgi:hypothetical protein